MSGITCDQCRRTLAVGEEAWANDWKVIGPNGVRLEVRYTCDDCAAEHHDWSPWAAR